MIDTDIVIRTINKFLRILLSNVDDKFLRMFSIFFLSNLHKYEISLSLTILANY